MDLADDGNGCMMAAGKTKPDKMDASHPIIIIKTVYSLPSFTANPGENERDPGKKDDDAYSFNPGT